MKLILFAPANFALPILEALKKHHELVAVVTTPDAPVGRKRQMEESPISILAKELSLKTFKPEKLDANFKAELAALQPELFVVVAYGKILPTELIDLPQLKTINIHASLLPKYRGATPIQAALFHGDTETGTTIMLMRPELDTGPILAQEHLLIEAEDTYLTLADKLAKLSVNILLPAIESYAAGKLEPKNQDEAQASWTKIITKNDGRIDWNRSAWDIYNQFRAYFPWPGIWTEWNGQVLKILYCAPLSDKAQADKAPGAVLESGIVVCGNQTLLQIKSLQLAGKNETDIDSFLRGYKDFVSAAL